MLRLLVQYFGRFLHGHDLSTLDNCGAYDMIVIFLLVARFLIFFSISDISFASGNGRSRGHRVASASPLLPSVPRMCATCLLPPAPRPVPLRVGRGRLRTSHASPVMFPACGTHPSVSRYGGVCTPPLRRSFIGAVTGDLSCAAHPSVARRPTHFAAFSQCFITGKRYSGLEYAC